MVLLTLTMLTIYSEAKAIVIAPGYDSCNVYGVVHFSNLEGGCWYIQLIDGTKIEPVSVLTNDLLIDGQEVMFSYIPAYDVASICMIGQLAYITCIQPIDTVNCDIDFEYYPIRCSPEMSSIRCGNYNYMFQMDMPVDQLVYWNWIVNDTDSSFLYNPVFVFDKPGKYNVCLNVDYVNGCHASICKVIEIALVDCQAEFEYYDLSSMVYNASTLDPAMKIMPAYPPYTYSFVDKSYGDVIEWKWEIDDTVMFQQNAIYSFQQSGYHKACLSITTSDGCSSKECKDIYIDTVPECYASFNYFKQDIYPIILDNGDTVYESVTGDFNPDIIISDKTVYFVDQSGGDVISWSWDFGDSTSSDMQYPIHTYQYYGKYNVCLTIKTALGCIDTYCTQLAISTPNSCISHFEYCTYDTYHDFNTSINPGYLIGFKDKSIGNISAWTWDFGDGNVSYEQNPMHVYQNSGVYSVCLQVYGDYGCYDRTCKIVMAGVDCDVDFSWNAYFPNCEGYKPVYEFNVIGVYDSIDYVYWDFGDGTSSSYLKPLHLFENFGEYNVCLTVKKFDGCKTSICKNIYQYQDQIDSLYLKNCGQTVIDKLENNSSLKVVKVYPVPANDRILFGINSLNNSDVKIEFYNLMGTLIKSDNFELLTGLNDIEINTVSLSNGYYIYKISCGNAVLRGNILIE